MSMSIDERIVSMVFDNKQFESGVKTSLTTLQQLKDSTDKLGSTKGFSDFSKAANNIDLSSISSSLEFLQDRFSTFGIVGMRIIENLTDSVLGFSKKVVGMVSSGGWSRAMNIEQAKFMLEGLGVAWSDVEDDINYGVQDTAYGLDAAAKAAASLTASGVKLGDEMKASLRGISGVAAMTNASYEEIAPIFTTVAGQGKLMTMQLRQLENRGLNAAAILGKQLGKTEAEIREMVTKGTIDFNTFATAMDDAFGQHAKDANKTFTGAMSNIRAALSRIGAKFATPIIQGVIEPLNNLRLIINGVNKNLDPVAKQFESTVATMSKAASRFLTNGELPKIVKSIVNSFRNVGAGIYNVIFPIKEAFKDVFPPKTMENAADLAKRIENLTHQFKNLFDPVKRTGESVEEFQKVAGRIKNLMNTFKGFFAIFDLGFQLISAVVRSLIPFTGTVGELADKALGVSGSFGEWLYNLAKVNKENDTFYNAIQKVINTLKPFTSLLKKVFNSIKEFFSSKIDTNNLFESISNFFKGLKKETEPAETLAEKLKNFFGKIKKAAEELKPVFDVLLSPIKTFFSSLKKSLSSLDTGDVLTSAFTIGFAKTLYDFANVLMNFSKKITNLKIKSVLYEVQKALQVYQNTLKADILLKIAGSILVLAVALSMLSSIDIDTLAPALGAITALFSELIGSMILLSKTGALDDISVFSKAGTTLMQMSAAVLILSFALKKISEIDPKNLAVSLGVITALLAELAGVAVVLGKFGGKIKSGSSALIMMALSILILTKSIDILGKMDPEKLAHGLTSVIEILATLAGVMLVTQSTGFGTSQGLGIIAMAAGIILLTKAVGILGEMKLEVLQKGIVSIVILIAAFALLMTAAADSKRFISLGLSFIIIAYAMGMLVDSISAIGALPIQNILKGVGAIVAILVAIGAFLFILNNVGNSLFSAVSLYIVAEALIPLADVLTTFGKMTKKEIAKSLIELAGALIILGIAMAAMQNFVFGAMALALVAAVLPLLADSLATLGSMKLSEIGKALLALLGTFVVLGLAALVLGPISPVILLLAASLLALGVSIALIGGGIALLATGLSLLAAISVTTAQTIGKALDVLITSFLNTIQTNMPLILELIGSYIEGICTLIIEKAPLIVEAIITVVSLLIEAAVTLVPQLVEGILTIVDEILGSFAEHSESIAESVTEILMGLLTGAINGVAERVGELIDACWNFMVNLIDGIADGIEEHEPELKEAFKHLFEAAWNGLLDFFGIHSPSEKGADMGDNIILGVIEGLGRNIADIPAKLKESVQNGLSGIGEKIGSFKEKGSELIDNIKSGLGNGTEIKSSVEESITNARDAIHDKLDEFKEKGRQMVSHVKNGIDSLKDDPKGAIGNIITNAISEAKSKAKGFIEVGRNMVTGLVNGINEFAHKAIDKMKSLAQDMIDKAKQKFDEHSPSKVFAQIGQFVVLGLVEGIDKNEKSAIAATSDMAESMIDSMHSVVAEILNAMNGEFDMDPVITPVVDLTDVETKAALINGMLSPEASAMSARLTASTISSAARANEANSEEKKDSSEISYNFTQNNYSPKALSRIDIYRNTRNQIMQIREVARG